MNPAPNHASPGGHFSTTSRAQSLVITGLNRFAAIALVSVTLGALLFPRGQEWVPKSIWIPLWCAVGLVGIFLARRFVAATDTATSRYASAVQGVALALATGVVSAVIGRALSYDFGWDAGEVMRAASALSSGTELGDYPYDYFSRYPYNVPLLGLDRVIVAMGAVAGTSLASSIAIVNSVALVVISLSVYVSVRTLSSHRAALLGQVTVLVFLGCSPWLAVPYTDVPVAALIAFAFASGTLAGRARLRVATVLGLAVCSGAAAGAAISLKPTASILVIAAVLGGVIASVRGTRGIATLRIGTSVAIAVAVALVTGAVAPAVVGLDLSRIDHTREFPMHHFARMGMIEAPGTNGSVRYGGYDVDAVQQMREAQSLEERKLQSSDAIIERLQHLGPVGYATFLVKKAIWIWSDGTFGGWVEGSDETRQLYRNGPLSAGIQQILHPWGKYWTLWSNAVTGLWLALLAATGMLLWRRAQRGDILVLSLCVLGIGAFSLLFEGRSRYLIIFVPLIAVLFSILLGSRTRSARPAHLDEARQEIDIP